MKGPRKKKEGKEKKFYFQINVPDNEALCEN